MRIIEHYISGMDTADGRLSEVFDPATGSVQAQVRLADSATIDRAVTAAKAAQPAWAAMNPQRRARVMFRFKELIEREMESLARLLSQEHGKVVADSKGDIQRGLDVIEFCAGAPHALKERNRAAGPAAIVQAQRW